MNYYTIGKVAEQGPIAEGTSSNGNTWQRMTLVLDVQVGQYTKKMAFQVSTGNVPGVMAFKVGDKVEVSWDIVSREWTNKDGVRSWFTQADLRSIKAAEVVMESAMNEPSVAEDDDLPFNG